MARFFEEVGENEFGDVLAGHRIVRHRGRKTFVADRIPDPLPFPHEPFCDIRLSRVDAQDEKSERLGLKRGVFEKRPPGGRPGTEKERGAKGAVGERPAKRYGRFLANFVLLGGVRSLCFSYHGVYKTDYVSEREPSYLSTCPAELAR